MTPSNTPREADLPTSWSEERARTLDSLAPGRSRLAPGPAPGAVLKNRFVLLECLADGPASRLFCAHDRQREANGEADARVALKIVTAAADGEPRALRALRREATIGLNLDHPNLPRILSLDHDGPHTFLSMEWLRGESLATILDSRGSRPMTRVQALHIIDGVCRALAYLHSQRITHADVKPGNILVSPEGEATLLDFGVAVGPGASDQPAVRGYTAEYASPEVLGGAEPTPLDDIFSLACVTYRMLSGCRAFGLGSARDAVIVGMRPARPDSLSPNQWRALDRGLAFSRTKRQPDVTTFLTQLKGGRDESAALTDLSAGESLATPFSLADVGPGRRRFWPALVIVVGVLAAGTLTRYRGAVLGQRESIIPPVAATSGESKPTTAGSIRHGSPVDRSPLDPNLSAAPMARTVITPPPIAPPRTAVKTERPGPVDRRDIQASGTNDKPEPEPESEPAGNPGNAVVKPPDPGAPENPAVATLAMAERDLAPALPETEVASASVPFSSLAIRRFVEPDYPRKAAARRVSGWVDVAFTVDASGRTRDVRVINAEPPGVFDDAARSAVRRWRFAAAEGTVPPSSSIRVRFDAGQARRTL